MQKLYIPAENLQKAHSFLFLSEFRLTLKEKKNNNHVYLKNNTIHFEHTTISLKPPSKQKRNCLQREDSSSFNRTEYEAFPQAINTKFPINR